MHSLPYRTLSILLIAVFFCSQADAKPPHKFALGRYYGEVLPKERLSCYVCHLADDEISELSADELDPDALQPWNKFGRRLAELGKEHPEPIIDRLRLVAAEDADGDGIANELELIAGTSPGHADQRPTDDQLADARKVLETFYARQPGHPWNPTRPVVRPDVPAIADQDTVSPIDAFVIAEHQRLGLTMRPPAARPALLRRVYLDLIGLPPTREELQAFLNDESPDAYERVVERLLADVRYGERWGRHWMDIWRYSDWAGWGEQVRDSHAHIWRWRDWIIESLNADQGYDQMVLAMLAADELSPADQDALRATGFLVRNYKRLSREQWLTDTVDHTARTFLGVTLKCAQCHDHMYDLVSHEEYYQFRAVFEPYQVRIDPLPGLDPEKQGLARIYDADLDAPTYLYLRGDERTPDKDRPMKPGALGVLGGALSPEAVALPAESFYPALQPFAIQRLLEQAAVKVTAAQAALAQAQQQGAETALAQRQLAAAEAEVAALQARIAAEQAKYLTAEPSAEQIKSLSQVASLAERQANLAQAEVALLQLQQQLAALPDTPDDERVKKNRQELEPKLAEAGKKRDAALAATQMESDSYTPLGPTYPRTSSGRRLALARWIANPQNPLTARVAVNHLWARHFGRGLVATVDDFGLNGAPPTHPALVDWLAAEFMTPALPSPGGETRPWSMKHLHRLVVTSQTYRQASTYDPACAAIDADNVYLWRSSPRRVEAEVIRDSVLYVGGSLDLTQGGPELDHQQGLAIPRRSLYFRHAPEKQMLFLQLFDMAAPAECYERRESIVPQQALALANSELSVLQARRLARRLQKEGLTAPNDYITAGFEHLLNRAATNEELQTCAAFLEQQATYFQQHAGQLGPQTADFHDVSKPAAEPALRARENLIHVLLNHHEFVSIP